MAFQLDIWIVCLFYRLSKAENRRLLWISLEVFHQWGLFVRSQILHNNHIKQFTGSILPKEQGLQGFFFLRVSFRETFSFPD